MCRGCVYCDTPFSKGRSVIFCSTVCAFKDYVMSQNIGNMEDLIKFVRELFKDEFDEQEVKAMTYGLAEEVRNLSKLLKAIHYSELLMKAEDVKMGQNKDAAEPFFALAEQFHSFVDWI